MSERQLDASRVWTVAALLAAVLIAACAQPEQVIVVVTATPTPEERVDDKLARDVASQSPTPGAPTPPPAETPTSTTIPTPEPADAPEPASTPTPISTSTPTPQPADTPVPIHTPTPEPTDTPTPTSTPMSVPTDTPIPTNTPTRVPTSTPIPTNTPTPVPTSTPTPTNTPTPVPVVRLVLDAESTVAGYWSDGTADVEVTATLRNEGTLRLDGAREITAMCVAQGDELRDCREELRLSLTDGFAPSSHSFTLRLPMGATTLAFDYGESEPLTFNVEVPERILGVDRDVWECYSDRPPKGWSWETHDALCGGLDHGLIVEKWLGDVPVKVWAIGPPNYIELLESVLNEMSSLTGLEFEWVDSFEQADFRAYLGQTDTELLNLGHFDSIDALHGWGGLATARTRTRYGEVVSGIIWTKPSDDEIWNRGVILHEAMHVLVPIGHSNRPLSMMGCCDVEIMTPLDIELIKLNYHPLVRPGMSMDEVRDLVVITDELLDYTLIDSRPLSIESIDIIWDIYASLIQKNSMSFRVSGGWCGGSDAFGKRRGPIRVTAGNFAWHADVQWVFYDFHTIQFFAYYSEEDSDWRYLTRPSQDSDWELIDRETMTDYSSYWHWDGKLSEALRFLLRESSLYPARVANRLAATKVNDSLHIGVIFDRDFTYYSFGDVDTHLDLTLVVDPATLSLTGYTWKIHRNDWCSDYTEVATDFQLGTPKDTPKPQDFE